MSYFESRLKVNLNNLEEIEYALRICEELAIKNVILESKDNKVNFNSKIKSKLKKFSSINIYFRRNLKPENLDELKRELSQFGKRSEITSVETLDKQIQLQAAKDSRIDIISYSSDKFLKTINPGVISLIKQNNKFIEFSLATIMVENKAYQSKNLRNLYRGIQLAKSLKADYIISGDFNNFFELRNPRSLISVCTSLLGISIEEAKKAFGYNVYLLIRRMKDRYNEDYYENGVEFISEGEL